MDRARSDSAPGRGPWRFLPGVRRSERERFLFFLALLVLLSAAEAVGLAAVESLFLARLGPARLPQAFLGAAGAAFVTGLAYAVAVGSLRNDRLFTVLLAAVAATGGAAGLAALRGEPVGLVALFCLFWAGRGLFGIHYWTFASDHFDARSSQRLFPFFAFGSSVGGVLGGALVAGLARGLGVGWLVAGWVALLLAAAALLVLRRERLRRWVPLEAMEADDTSVARLRGAGRYLRGTRLGRWLVVSSLGMAVALFVAQYVYSDVFARAFPDADRLALFFGVFLTAANAVELVTELAVGRWLIPRLGVPTANLVHPFLTLGAFVGLAAAPGLGSALFARLNRESFESALAVPVRNLSYNALPHRLRGRVQGFLEGVVANLGMAGAGGLLLVAGPGTALAGASAVGAAAAALYAVANFGVRREYTRAILEDLRAGRLDLREIEAGIGAREAGLLASFWQRLLAEEAPSSERLLASVARVLARHGQALVLLAALDHPRVEVRRAALAGVLDEQAPGLEAAVERALCDPEPGIRSLALRALREGRHAFAEPVRGRLRACAAHPAPEVRAGAAALLGAEGWPVLARMLEAGGAQAAAALHALPGERLAEATARTGDPDPAVRSASLSRLAGAADAELPRAAARRSLDDPDARVRAAAVRVLACSPQADDVEALVARLGDTAREVRGLAGRALAALGAPAVAPARRLLAAEASVPAEAAQALLAELATPEALSALRLELRRRAQASWEALLAARLLPRGGEDGLRLALEDAVGRDVRRALRLLAALEPPGVVRMLEKTLRFARGRVRADALEALSQLGDRVGVRLLVALLEEGPLEERAALVRGQLRPPRDLEQVLERAGGFGRYARAAVARLRPAPLLPQPEEVPMERLLLLRRVPLFAQMSLEQLERIDALMTEAQYQEGERIVGEGEAGDELFVVLEGEVRFFKQAGGAAPLYLSTSGAGSYFGEMAILSDEPRSATALAALPTRVSVLSGDRLKELILEVPEIAFELLRALAARVRVADDRLAELRAARS